MFANGHTLVGTHRDGRAVVLAQPAGSITVEHEDAGSVLWLRGEVDAPVVDAFVRTLPELPAVVAIDAGEVEFADSTVVALLIRCARRAADDGVVITLRRASKHVDRLLELVGAQDLFTRER